VIEDRGPALTLHRRIGDQSIGADIVEMDAPVLSILREAAQQHPRHEVLILVIRHIAIPTPGAQKRSPIIELGGARALVRRHGLRVFERAAGFKIGGDARGAEGMAADPGARVELGGPTHEAKSRFISVGSAPDAAGRAVR
jgi:hypothetical protein